jgi:hypothetical protein
MLVMPELFPIADKGMGMRLPLYLIVAFLGPWLSRRHGPSSRYRRGDLYLLLALSLDVIGNAFGGYQSLRYYDDVAHFAIVLLLTLAATAFYIDIENTPHLRLTIIGMAALMAMGWEIAEWWNLQIGIRSLQLTYDDTITDMIYSLAGGVVAAQLIKSRPRVISNRPS